MSEHIHNPVIPEGLQHIGSTHWMAVKKAWKSDEDSDSFRREYAEQGFSSWEEWREIIITPLHLDRLSWQEYSVTTPSETVPTFRGGPFQPWADQYYDGKEAPTFAEIAASNNSDVKTRGKFKNIIEADKPIQLMGLLLNSEVYIVEGMHRATSIALAAARGITLHSPTTLLLAESDLSKFEMIA